MWVSYTLFLFFCTMKSKHLLSLFSFFFLSLSWAQIQRVEPPYWWANMENPSLEILVYGDRISEYTIPPEKHPFLRDIKKVNNPNYLFLELDLSDQKPDTIVFEFHHAEKSSIVYNYPILKRENGSRERKSFDASDVIYLLMPDRFANGNLSNDSVEEMTDKYNRSDKDGRHGGDIQGIIDHVDYIHNLGATAIWSTPLCEDNDAQVSYHTYAQSDLYRIDPRYGTHDDYKNLAEALHQRDMHLIMDYVTNHWGIEHWMVKDLPMPDWIHQFPSYQNTNHRKEIFSDPYAAKKDYDILTQGWFVPTMPDLNQSNPFVLRYLTQNAIWWIESTGLDGFRVDTYPYNDPLPMVQWIEAIKAEYPYFNIVGEGWMHNTIHTSYWQENSAIAALNDFNSGLPAVMDFPLTDALTVAFNENNSYWESGTTRFYKNFQNDFLYPNIHNVLVFAENHDTQRINEIYPNIQEYKQLMTVLMTIRGIPQIYYGSEIGMRGKKSEGDGDIRRDFPGGWPGDPQNAFDPSQQTKQQKAYFSFTQKLLQWRKNKTVIHSGKTLHYIPENDVYVYFRYNEEERVMVIINNNKEDQSLRLDRFSEGIQQYTSVYDVLNATSFTLKETLEVKGQSSLILELR